MLGDCFLWEVFFFESDESKPKLGFFFRSKSWCINFEVGLGNFGRLFHKLIWPPCTHVWVNQKKNKFAPQSLKLILMNAIIRNIFARMPFFIFLNTNTKLINSKTYNNIAVFFSKNLIPWRDSNLGLLSQNERNSWIRLLASSTYVCMYTYIE
jgi:hypothetical protein